MAQERLSLNPRNEQIVDRTAAQELSFDKILGLPDDRDMTSPRRNAIFIFAWVLFWVLMMLVAVQDFLRNEHSYAL